MIQSLVSRRTTHAMKFAYMQRRCPVRPLRDVSPSLMLRVSRTCRLAESSKHSRPLCSVTPRQFSFSRPRPFPPMAWHRRSSLGLGPNEDGHPTEPGTVQSFRSPTTLQNFLFDTVFGVPRAPRRGIRPLEGGSGRRPSCLVRALWSRRSSLARHVTVASRASGRLTIKGSLIQDRDDPGHLATLTVVFRRRPNIMMSGPVFLRDTRPKGKLVGRSRRPPAKILCSSVGPDLRPSQESTAKASWSRALGLVATGSPSAKSTKNCGKYGENFPSFEPRPRR